MGDIADRLIEEGMDELLAHNTGECDAFCPYCLDDDEDPTSAPVELTCPEPDCGAPMVLRVTRRAPWTGRKFYGCSRFPECRSTHGAHPDGTPLGIPATKATKQARIRAHDVFDQLHRPGRMTRSQAYVFLAKRMGMSKDECHIGRFDAAQCDQVIAIATRRLRKGFKRG